MLPSSFGLFDEEAMEMIMGILQYVALFASFN